MFSRSIHQKAIIDNIILFSVTLIDQFTKYSGNGSFMVILELYFVELELSCSIFQTSTAFNHIIFSSSKFYKNVYICVQN